MTGFLLGVIFGGIVVGAIVRITSPQYRMFNSEEYRIAFNTMVTRLGRLQGLYTATFQSPPKFNEEEFREAHEEFNVSVDNILSELGRLHGSH